MRRRALGIGDLVSLLNKVLRQGTQVIAQAYADLLLTWSWPISSRSSSFSHLLVGGRLSSFVGVCCSKWAVRWRVVFSVAAIEAVATKLPASLWPGDGVQPDGAAALPDRALHATLNAIQTHCPLSITTTRAKTFYSRTEKST